MVCGFFSQSGVEFINPKTVGLSVAECGTGEHTLGMAVGEEADVLDGRELNVWVEEQRVDSLVEVCVVERRGEEGGWVR